MAQYYRAQACRFIAGWLPSVCVIAGHSLAIFLPARSGSSKFPICHWLGATFSGPSTSWQVRRGGKASDD